MNDTIILLELSFRNYIMAFLLFMNLQRLSLLGSCQGQSSQGLGNWRADLLPWQRVSEVEENSNEKLCPLGHKSSKTV